MKLALLLFATLSWQTVSADSLDSVELSPLFVLRPYKEKREWDEAEIEPKLLGDSERNRIKFDRKFLEEFLARRRVNVPGGDEKRAASHVVDTGISEEAPREEDSECFARLGEIMASYSNFSEAIAKRSWRRIFFTGSALAKKIYRAVKCFTLSAVNYLVESFGLKKAKLGKF